MIYRIKDNEFDFSLAVHKIDDAYFIDNEIPEIIEEEIVNIFNQALTNFIDKEYRFVGIVDNDEVIIFRCYVRNGHIWENVIYDELTEILETVKHLDGVHRILNCLMYECS